MRLGTLLVVLVVGITLTLASVSGTAWAATSWVVHETTGTGEARARTSPRRAGQPRRHLRRPDQCQDDQGHVDRRHPRHRVHDLRLDDLRHGDLRLHRDRDDLAVDERHADGWHELLVRGGRQHREQLEQREVVRDRREHHRLRVALLCPAVGLPTIGGQPLGGWSSGQAPGGWLKLGSRVHDPCDQSPAAGGSPRTAVMSTSSASA